MGSALSSLPKRLLRSLLGSAGTTTLLGEASITLPRMSRAQKAWTMALRELDIQRTHPKVVNASLAHETSPLMTASLSHCLCKR